MKQKLSDEDKELFLEERRELCLHTRLKQTEDHRQNGITSVYHHCCAVAAVSLALARRYRIPVDARSLVRGALLHDYFLYDWHEAPGKHKLHGFTHPKTALRNAMRDTGLNEIEKDIIIHHMFPLTPIPPKSREGMLVCTADKICAAKETMEGLARVISLRRIFE